jgi:hypothetical protein
MKFSPPIRFSWDGDLVTANVSFTEALQRQEVRALLPTTLSSAQLERISGEILERALFSARTTSAEYLQEVDDVLQKYINGEIDLASARLRLSNKLRELGYAPRPGEEGAITDLSSDERINLVLRTNADMASGYGQWLQGQDKAILDQWPAQELYRAAHRMVPRDWATRWVVAGGQTYGGKFIALKNTTIWTAISRFGTPYPPFDFNSGMAVRDVDRKTAMSLGLIDRDTQIQPQDRGFNQDLKATPQIRSAALRSVLEEQGYTFDEKGMMHL